MRTAAVGPLSNTITRLLFIRSWMLVLQLNHFKLKNFFFPAGLIYFSLKLCKNKSLQSFPTAFFCNITFEGAWPSIVVLLSKVWFTKNQINMCFSACNSQDTKTEKTEALENLIYQDSLSVNVLAPGYLNIQNAFIIFFFHVFREHMMQFLQSINHPG